MRSQRASAAVRYVSSTRIDRHFVGPAKLNATAHSRSRSHSERTRFQIAIEHAGLQQLDARRGFDIAGQLAADNHGVGTHFAGELRAGFYGEVALHMNVAFEFA